MGEPLQTPGFHHAAIRVTDLERAKAFYGGMLGLELLLEVENLLLYRVGAHALGIRGPEADTPPGDTFSPFRVGMDHLAIACEDEAQLYRLERILVDAGVWTTGVKDDELLRKRYIAFKDPDGIKLEYYMV